jgi:signal transduction histidine kinase
VRPLATAARGVLGGGRFISVWSIAASLALSFTVMAPAVPDPTAPGVLPALVAGWLSFAAGLSAVAAAERTARRVAARATWVATGVLLDAAARPVIHDLWLSVLGVPAPPPGQLPFRILTNVLVWAVALTAVALVVDAARSLRATNALLSAVRMEMDAAQHRGEAFEAAARAEVKDAVVDLRRRIGALRGDSATVASVWWVGDGFRAASHAVSQRAREADAAGTPAARVPARGRDRLVLRAPPPGIVTVLYAVCMLPYALRAATSGVIVLALVVAVGGGWAVDRLTRLRVLRRTGRSAVVFVALSTVVGAMLSIVASADGAGIALATVPLLAYGGLSLGAALCTGMLHRLRTEQIRLASAVAGDQRATRAATVGARAALRDAADVMHRDGQAVCVIFAMENASAPPDRFAALATQLDGIVDRVEGVFHDSRPVTGASSLTELADTWSRALAVDAAVTPEAFGVLDAHPDLAARAFEVAAEGLLNAAKHAGTARTTLTVDTVMTGAGERLTVRVVTRTPAIVRDELGPHSRARELGARLRSVDGGVVLEAALDVPGARSVVSAEHPAEGVTAEP